MRAGVWTANLRQQSFPGRNCVLGRGVLYGLHYPSPRSSQSAPFGSRSTDEAHLRSLSQLRHFAESFSLCADQFKGKIQDGERGRFGPWRNCGCRGRWRRCAVAELESRIRARGIWIRPLFRGGVRKPCHRRLHNGGRLPKLASSGSKILSKRYRLRGLPFRVCHQRGLPTSPESGQPCPEEAIRHGQLGRFLVERRSTPI
jgi:hypothetical protein